MAASNNKKKSKLRRSQVRRQRSDTRESWFKRLRERIGLMPPSIALGFFVLATVIILYDQDPFPYSPGQEVQHPIYARVEFDIPDEKATEQERQKAREGTPNYYILNEKLVNRIRGTINKLYNVAQQHETYEAYLQAKIEVGEEAGEDDQWQLSEGSFNELHALGGEEGKASLTGWLDRLDEELRKERLVRIGDDRARTVQAKSNIAVLRDALSNNDEGSADTKEIEVDTLDLEYFSDTNLKAVTRAAKALAEEKNIFPLSLQATIREIMEVALQEAPLFRFDLKLTEEMMDAEAAKCMEVKTIYNPFWVLAKPKLQDEGGTDQKESVGKKEYVGRYRLDNEQIALLKHEHAKYTQLLTQPLESLDPAEYQVALALREQQRFKQVGIGAVVLLITLGLIVYCWMFQSRVIQNPVRASSIAVLFLIMIAISRMLFLGEVAVRYPLIVVAPIVMTAAILTMVYSQRFAIGMTAALALLVTMAVRGDLGMLLVLTASMSVAIYQLREIRSRNELFSTGLLDALAALLVAMSTGLIAGHSFEAVVPHAIVAAVTALGSIAIFILFLSPIERIFKVATNWTLLDLLDTSRPLLVRLAREAPGTFAHSLWLSNLAESACERIGSNALLAKVGAMYHDIGKVHKAEYFSENQEANINRHDNLAPTMSLLVIVGHVKDGVELAKEEGLPPAVIRFIEEHHGTTVVRYFHHVASEQQKAAGGGREISETEFRYPGPKPRSKETAILMLCDGVEGAVRALQEPTAGRIENVVHNVLMERLNDGQFEECEITLKELHQVEETLVKNLCRFYHGRVTYPKAVVDKTGTNP